MSRSRRSAAATLFGESASRAVVSVTAANLQPLLQLAAELGVPARSIGRTGGDADWSVTVAGSPAIDCRSRKLNRCGHAHSGVTSRDEQRRITDNACRSVKHAEPSAGGARMPFKDECGVFGIFGHPEAANLTYLGLYALQHRGQESAGIASADGEKLRISRAMGQVAEAFNEQTLQTLPGHIAVGHTRYSTAGESKLENAQPFLIDCAHGQIAVVPQRQPRQRPRAPRRARAQWIDLSDRAATPKSSCTSTPGRGRHRSKRRSASRSPRFAAPIRSPC